MALVVAKEFTDLTAEPFLSIVFDRFDYLIPELFHFPPPWILINLINQKNNIANIQSIVD